MKEFKKMRVIENKIKQDVNRDIFLYTILTKDSNSVIEVEDSNLKSIAEKIKETHRKEIGQLTNNKIKQGD